MGKQVATKNEGIKDEKEKKEKKKLKLAPKLKELGDVEAIKENMEKLQSRRVMVINLLASMRQAMAKEGTGDLGDNDPLASLKPHERRRLPWYFEDTRKKNSIWQKFDATCHGKDLCDALFDYLDRDQDGYLHFDDFRGYLSLVGRLNKELPFITDTKEGWELYMSDLFETQGGTLTKKGWKMYREMIEDQYPLEFDLNIAKRNLLPPDLARWKKAKDTFFELDLIQHAKTDRIAKDKLDIEYFQILLAECGEYYEYKWIREMLHRNSEHVAQKNGIQKRFFNKNKMSRDEPIIDISVKETMSRKSFIGWFNAGRPKPTISSLKKVFIGAKAWTRVFIKKTMTTMGFFADHWFNGINRGMIHGGIFKIVKNDIGRIDLMTEIGNQTEVGNGISMQCNYAVYNSEKAARNGMSMPQSAGAAICFDLLIKSSAKKRRIKECVERLSGVIETHFTHSIRSILKLHSWRVYDTKSDIDSAAVIRLAIFFKQECHFDARARQYKLGFTFRDLVTEMKSKVETSFPLDKILQDPEASLSDFGLRAELTSTYCKGILSAMLRELSGTLDDVHREAEFELVAQSGGEREAINRTYQSHPNIDYRFLRETFKYHYTDKPAVDEEVPGFDKPRSLFGGSNTHLINFDLYNMSKNFLKDLIKFVEGTKSVNTEWKFPRIDTVLFETRWLRALLPHWLLQGHFTYGGVVKRWANDFTAKLEKDIQEIVSDIETYDKDVAEEEAAERRKRRERLLAGDLEVTEEEIAKKEAEKEKTREKLKEDLKSLGVTADEIDNMYRAAESMNRAALLKQARKEQVEDYRKLLSVYNSFFYSTSGIHSVTICTGKYKFYSYFTGLDLFDYLLPDPDKIPFFVKLEEHNLMEAGKAIMEQQQKRFQDEAAGFKREKKE